MATIQQILAAVRTVAAGGTAFPREAQGAIRSAMRVPTPRELEILILVADGLSNADIAERLGLRVKTVESQLRRMFDRYDIASRTALVHLAEGQGWLAEGR
jgi:DNA-binding NarL/FixJ family response regulator